MTDDSLNKLFEEARSQSTEIKVEEVAGWVSVAAGIGTVGLLSQLKLKLLTKKGIMYLGTLLIGVGIGVTTLIGFKDDVKTTNVIPTKIEAEKSKKTTESVVLFDSTVKNKVEEVELPTPPVPSRSENQVLIGDLPISPILLTPLLPDLTILSSPVVPEKVLEKGFLIEERKVGSFTKLNLRNAFKVEIRQGETESLRIEASERIMSSISTKTVGGELTVSLLTKNNNLKKEKYNSKKDEDIKVYITVVNLEEVKLSGVVELKSVGNISSDHLKINTSGASEIELNLTSKSIDVVCSGASELSFTGSTSTFTLETSGVSEVLCSGLSAESVVVNSSGASDVYVKVENKLAVHASGASNIKYLGSPVELEVNSSGASSIKKL